MNTKTTIVLLAILIIVVGWFAYSKGKERALINVVKTTLDSNTTASGGQVPSASFACRDNSHFIAEFPNEKEVKIIVDGNLLRTLPRVAGNGQRFEDGTYVYVFAGEEVNVTNKSTNKSTVCGQPNDPNNAPMNFGDAAEGGAGFNTGNNGSVAKPDIALIVSENIVGSWKSNEDARFTREFKNNGIVSDLYDGKVVTTGKWTAFTSLKPLKVSFPIEADAVYIQMTTTGNENDTLNFKLAKLTPESLELIYMDRGGINTFTRIK